MPFVNNNQCEYIHKLFNDPKLIRHKFPFDKDKKEIPLNGIYILFEKGERAHSGDRIVRVGTHTGQNNLYSRLNQHFLLEKKDRSIFRKNIGRAILNKDKDDFLNHWELDLTTRAARNKYLKSIDMEKQKKIENKVTKYIQDNFSFIVFKVDDKNNRLELESKIISTVSWCNECKQSDKWFGKYSPKNRIRESGLWQERELWKTPLNNEEIKYIEKIVKQGNFA
jgi:hypothetical protein